MRRRWPDYPAVCGVLYDARRADFADISVTELQALAGFLAGRSYGAAPQRNCRQPGSGLQRSAHVGNLRQGGTRRARRLPEYGRSPRLGAERYAVGRVLEPAMRILSSIASPLPVPKKRLPRAKQPWEKFLSPRSTRLSAPHPSRRCRLTSWPGFLANTPRRPS